MTEKLSIFIQADDMEVGQFIYVIRGFPPETRVRTPFYDLESTDPAQGLVLAIQGVNIPLITADILQPETGQWKRGLMDIRHRTFIKLSPDFVATLPGRSVTDVDLNNR